MGCSANLGRELTLGVGDDKLLLEFRHASQMESFNGRKGSKDKRKLARTQSHLVAHGWQRQCESGVIVHCWVL
jgi:hypothetical protein